MNLRELFEVHVPERLAQSGAIHGRRDEICKFQVTGKGGGTWVIDFSTERPVVRKGNDDAHCVIQVSADDLLRISQGELNPRALFLAGRLKVAGYLDLAIKMAKMLEPIAIANSRRG